MSAPGMALVVQHCVCTLGNCNFHFQCVHSFGLLPVISLLKNESIWTVAKGVKSKIASFKIVHLLLLLQFFQLNS